MKLKILIGVAFMMSAFVAKAEGKEPLQVNFNQLIDDGQNTDAGLNHDLSGQYKEAAALDVKDTSSDDKAEVKDDSQTVHDFVTFEVIQMKKDEVATEKPVVKRKYNSVGEPRVATLPEVEMIPLKVKSHETN